MKEGVTVCDCDDVAVDVRVSERDWLGDVDCDTVPVALGVDDTLGVSVGLGEEDADWEEDIVSLGELVNDAVCVCVGDCD